MRNRLGSSGEEAADIEIGACVDEEVNVRDLTHRRLIDC